MSEDAARVELKLERTASQVERRPGLMVLLLSLLYIGLIFSPMGKILWHDELFTFYIAQSPTIAKFIDSVQHADWQPPLIFATAWLSQHIFGVNEFATRLPTVLAFFGASIGLLYVLKSRLGVIWAAVAVLLFWFSFYFKYATEARPYGLLIGFFILALFSYDRAIDPQFSANRKRYLAGFWIGNAGMMLSHILAPFSMMPFGAAELVRTVQRRKVDWPLWFALIAPLGIAAESLSNVGDFQQSYFPVIFQASFRKMAVFFSKVFLYVWPLILLGTAAALVTKYFIRAPRERNGLSGLPAPYLAFAGALLLPPALVNLLLMRSSGAFWERYCITTALLLYVLVTVAVAWTARFSRAASLVVFAVVLIAGLVKTAAEYRPSPPLYRVEMIRPDLPLVAASGLAFLEMDHYERPEFLKRLYYLTDRPSAIRYAHATLFEGFGTLNRYFPVRANALPYSEFIANHKHFMVFGTPEVVEDWLFHKLKDEGAQIGKAQPVTTPYRDYAVYEVTLGSEGRTVP